MGTLNEYTLTTAPADRGELNTIEDPFVAVYKFVY
jgi:hypothetical protein